MTAGEVSATLAIVMTIGTGFAGWNSLNEAKTKHQEDLADHNRRIYALEMEQASGTREHALEMKIGELTYEVQQLKEQILELRKKK